MLNAAVLHYVADRFPDSGLAPQGGMPRYRLQQWLNFITSELHKVVFIPLLDPRSGEDSKAYAYLVTVLNWARFSGIDLTPYRRWRRISPACASVPASHAR